MITRRSPQLIGLQCLLLGLSRIAPAQCAGGADSAAGSGGGVYGGRHSYSLSTFSPSGDIDQVVRAMRASMLGAPIVALSISSTRSVNDEDDDDERDDAISSSTTTTTGSGRSRPLSPRGGIYISMPLRFLAASPLTIDDGTPRVVMLTSTICVAHAGVGADGRALCDYARDMASDHDRLYGEEMPVEELLDGLAGRAQEMTMKAGSRPYGCALLVGCLGCDDDDDDRANVGPTMYRVDPSGAVAMLNPPDCGDASGTVLDIDASRGSTTGEAVGRRRGSAAFLGNWDPLRREKEAVRRELEDRQYANEEEVRSALMDVVNRTFLVDGSSSTGEEIFLPSGGGGRPKRPILFASFTREFGLRLSRIMGE